jgi:hypothetical protein
MAKQKSQGSAQIQNGKFNLAKQGEKQLQERLLAWN